MLYFTKTVDSTILSFIYNFSAVVGLYFSESALCFYKNAQKLPMYTIFQKMIQKQKEF